MLATPALQFGTFLTPVNDPPAAAVELAQLSEQLGYDLVTFQDHPYQPAFHDTWTLLSWVAGRTERIHLAANVLNLPLRPPAVLARAAASLDLLSGGRFELALGAGAFWDAIVAMGGERRTPGEAVDALGEAIDVVRETWSLEPGGPLSYAGRHYRLDGAARGPEPAHDIPIWVGAAKPRMLRLIGRKADGWMTTLSRLGPGELRAGNTTIDDAATAAGRDPREIRRIVTIAGTFQPTRSGFLVGPAASWAEDLLPLVLDDGIGTLVLMTDEPRALREFALEVVPALREAVARALPDAGPGSRPVTIRRTSARAKRREGIDYDSVPAALVDVAIEPGDVGYAGVRSTYLRGGSPGLVLQARTVGEVRDAIAFARLHPDLPLAVRSGSHGISGRSTNDGGIVIDLSRMDAIEILDAATRRVRIEPGARWMEVAAALEPYGWALSSGDYGGVGVGGLATAGGIGFLGREHGLTIDHLRAVEMVLADGSVVRADPGTNADLFWAVRGAGANFGIVTSFEFEVDEIGDVGWAQLVMDASDTAGFLESWGAAVERSPRDLTSFVIVGPPRNGQPALAQVFALVDAADPDTIIERLQPIAQISPLYQQSVQLTSYASVMANAHGPSNGGQGEPVTRSGLLEHVTPEFALAAQALIRSGAAYFFQLRAVGGAVSDVAPDATAYAHRSANFSVVAFGSSRERLNAGWQAVYPHLDGLYVSFETDLSPERLEDAFPPRTLARLRELKARLDPLNLFRDNFNVAPKSAADAGPVGAVSHA